MNIAILSKYQLVQLMQFHNGHLDIQRTNLEKLHMLTWYSYKFPWKLLMIQLKSKTNMMQEAVSITLIQWNLWYALDQMDNFPYFTNTINQQYYWFRKCNFWIFLFSRRIHVKTSKNIIKWIYKIFTNSKNMDNNRIIGHK